MSHTVGKITKTILSKNSLTALISALIISGLSTTADYYRVLDGCKKSTALPLPVEAILWLACGYAVIMFLLWFWDAKKDENEPTKQTKPFLIITLALFTCWMLLWILPNFPGNMRDDTLPQLFQYNGLYPLYSQHPAFDTFVFGFFIDSIGTNILGNPNYGLFLFIILNALLLAASLSYTLIYARKHGTPKVYIVVLTVIACVCAAFYEPAEAMSKDSFNAWMFLLVFLFFIETIRTKGENLSSPKNLIIAIILITLCMVTKRTMGIVAAISFAVLIIYFAVFHRKHLIQAIVVFLVPSILVLGVWSSVCTNVLHVTDNKTYELYSVPAQQLVLTAKEHSEILEDGTLDGISEYMDINKAMEDFNYWRSDEVWCCFTQSPGSDFLSTWLSVGLRYPDTYAEAFFDLAGGWFSLDTAIAYGNGQTNGLFADDKVASFTGFFNGDYDKTKEIMDKYEPSSVEFVPSIYTRAAEHLLGVTERHLTLFQSYGLWCFAIPLIVACWCLTRRKWNALLALLPIGLLIGTLIIGPITLFWYAAPMVYCAPLILCLPFIFASKQNKDPLKNRLIYEGLS